MRIRAWTSAEKNAGAGMLSWIRGLASEPCSRVLHGQFSKKHGQFNHARPRLDYASAMRMPGPPAECGRAHWGVPSPHHLCPVHGFLDPVSGKSLWWKQHTIFSHFQANRKIEWIQVHRFICQGNVWHWQPSRRSSSVVWRTELTEA